MNNEKLNRNLDRLYDSVISRRNSYESIKSKRKPKVGPVRTDTPDTRLVGRKPKPKTGPIRTDTPSMFGGKPKTGPVRTDTPDPRFGYHSTKGKKKKSMQDIAVNRLRLKQKMYAKTFGQKG